MFLSTVKRRQKVLMKLEKRKREEGKESFFNKSNVKQFPVCIWYIHLHTHSEEDFYPSYFGRALRSCHTKACTHKGADTHTPRHRKKLPFITSLHTWPVAAYRLTGCSSFILGNGKQLSHPKKQPVLMNFHKR